jgi:hypothetical protein
MHVEHSITGVQVQIRIPTTTDLHIEHNTVLFIQVQIQFGVGVGVCSKLQQLQMHSIEELNGTVVSVPFFSSFSLLWPYTTYHVRADMI